MVAPKRIILISVILSSHYKIRMSYKQVPYRIRRIKHQDCLTFSMIDTYFFLPRLREDELIKIGVIFLFYCLNLHIIGCRDKMRLIFAAQAQFNRNSHRGSHRRLYVHIQLPF